MSTGTAFLSVRVPPPLRNRLKAAAARRGVSLQELMRAAVEELLAREEKQPPRLADVVFGSVARGDFNKWSDLDVLVVARGLPSDARARLEVLMQDAPPGLQAIGWTPAELVARRLRNDPIARECEAAGVVVFGQLPPRV